MFKFEFSYTINGNDYYNVITAEVSHQDANGKYVREDTIVNKIKVSNGMVDLVSDNYSDHIDDIMIDMFEQHLANQESELIN